MTQVNQDQSLCHQAIEELRFISKKGKMLKDPLGHSSLN